MSTSKASFFHRFCSAAMLAAIGVALLLPSVTLADGMIIRPHLGGWDYGDENAQRALISYEHGLQKMILSIGMGTNPGAPSVWIFPVPAEPNKVVIDTVSSLPQLNGINLSQKAKSSLREIRQYLWRSQIYPVFFPWTWYRPISYAPMPLMGFKDLAMGSEARVADVTTYEHLEKDGLTSEIVTAKTASGLYKYLQNKNLKIEKGQIPALENYIGQDFTFVVSWITDQGVADFGYSPNSELQVFVENNLASLLTPELTLELDRVLPGVVFEYFANSKEAKAKIASYIIKQRPDLFRFLPSSANITSLPMPPYPPEISPQKQRGVFVTFPTKEIYFPLMLTSVYGSKVVPADVRVLGLVSPNVFSDIKAYAKVSYWTDAYWNQEKEFKNFFAPKNQKVNYTKIELNAPSKMLTQDLWIRPRVPGSVVLPAFLALHPVLSGWLLVIIVSFLVGILAGLAVFKEARNRGAWWKFGVLGLANCVTVGGVIIATLFMRVRHGKEADKALVDELKRKGYEIHQRDLRKWIFVPVFSLGFLLMTWVVMAVLTWIV